MSNASAGTGPAEKAGDHFDAVPLRRVVLRGREAANADLDHPLDETVFKNTGHGAGMRKAVAFEVGVQIRVRVEVQQADSAVLSGESANHGIGNGMIAAQDD